MGCCQGLLNPNFNNQNECLAPEKSSTMQNFIRGSSFNQKNQISSVRQLLLLRESNSDQMYQKCNKLSNDYLLTSVFHQKYSLVKIISKGTQGVIWLAKNSQTGKKFVAKINKGVSQKTLLQAQRETEILQQFRAPNIIKLVDIYQDQNQYIQVFQYCQGGTLREWINQNQIFDVKLALDCFFNIIRALHYINRSNVAHRDIKPENIMFQRQAGRFPLVLIDFGATGKLQNGSKFSELYGTPLYLAPEVILGEYDLKCDVWSAGIILLEMLSKFQLAGINPFIACNVQGILEKIVYKDINFNEILPLDIGRHTIKLLSKVLSKDYESRPSAKWLWKNKSVFTLDRQEIIAIDEQIMFKWQKIKNLPNILKLFYNYILQNVIQNKIPNDILYRFTQLDNNNDGYITKSDIIAINHQWNTKDLEIADDQLFYKGKVSYNQYLIYSINWTEMLTEKVLQITYNKLIIDGEIKRIIQKAQNKTNQNSIENFLGQIKEFTLEEFKQFLLS